MTIILSNTCILNDITFFCCEAATSYKWMISSMLSMRRFLLQVFAQDKPDQGSKSTTPKRKIISHNHPKVFNVKLTDFDWTIPKKVKLQFRETSHCFYFRIFHSSFHRTYWLMTLTCKHWIVQIHLHCNLFSEVIIVNVLGHLKLSCQLLKGMFIVFLVMIKNESTGWCCSVFQNSFIAIWQTKSSCYCFCIPYWISLRSVNCCFPDNLSILFCKSQGKLNFYKRLIFFTNIDLTGFYCYFDIVTDKTIDNTQSDIIKNINFLSSNY